MNKKSFLEALRNIFKKARVADVERSEEHTSELQSQR